MNYLASINFEVGDRKWLRGEIVQADEIPTEDLSFLLESGAILDADQVLQAPNTEIPVHHVSSSDGATLHSDTVPSSGDSSEEPTEVIPETELVDNLLEGLEEQAEQVEQSETSALELDEGDGQ